MKRVLGLLVLVYAAGLVPAAFAADHLNVVINGQSTVSLVPDDDFAHDVGLVRCTLRSASGDAPDDYGDTSLKSIAAAAGVPADAVASMDVERADGSKVRIPGAEVQHGFGGDPDPKCNQAMVFYNGDNFAFFRPLRGDGAPNAGDFIQLSLHDTMTVDLTTTNTTLRTVRAHPDTTTPDADVKTGFTASVDNPGNGDPYTYAWDWGDGTTGAGVSTDHAYKPGSWRVTVTATGADGSIGISRPVTISVKGPPASTPTSTPTAQGTPGGNDGPGGSGAPTGSGDPNAPPSGQASPTVGPIGSPTPGGTGTPTAAPRHSATPRPHASSTPTPRGSSTPTATVSPTSTTSGTVTNPFGDPAPPPAVTGVATATPRASATQPSSKATPHKPTPTPTQTPQPAGAGIPVSGVLLAGVGDQTDLAKILQSVNQAQATATERPQVRRGGGGSNEWLGWTSGGGLLFLLLLAGAARERRRIAA